MADNLNGLIKYNTDGILGNLIAIESHLADSPGIPHQWCQKKHYLAITQHHIPELIIHAQNKNPELTKQVQGFRNKLAKVCEGSEPVNPADIRELRNEFRELINDPTLSNCEGVCSLDKRDGFEAKNLNSGSSLYNNEEAVPQNDSQMRMEVNRMKAMDLVVIGAGSFGGEGLAYLNDYIDDKAKVSYEEENQGKIWEDDVTFFKRTSTWVGFGTGVLLPFVGMYGDKMKLPKELSLGLAVAGTNILAKTTVKAIKDMIAKKETPAVLPSYYGRRNMRMAQRGMPQRAIRRATPTDIRMGDSMIQVK